MKRVTSIVTPLAVLVLLGAAGVFVPVAAAPLEVVPESVGATSLSCPSFSEATSASKTGVYPGDKTSTTGIGGASPQVVSGAVAVASSRTSVKLTGATNIAFGGTSVVTASTGPTRGLMLAPCRAPATEAWITGVTSNDSTVTNLVLTNIDRDEAAVDLTFFGADGRRIVAGARGVVVNPLSERTLPLASLISTKDPFTVHLSTSQGRVAVVARETHWQGSDPVGSDWVVPSELETSVVVSGVPGGSGERLLVVTNPGERSTTASISALTAEGAIALKGADQLEVPAQSTRTVALESGLQGEPTAIQVTAETPITAALRAESAAPGATSDIAILGTGSVLPPRVAFGVPAGKESKVQLVLANAGDDDATVAVGFGGDQKEITLVKGASVPVDAPSLPATAVTITTSSGQVHASVVVRRTLGKVEGLGAFSYVGLSEHAGSKVLYDPHVNTSKG